MLEGGERLSKDLLQAIFGMVGISYHAIEAAQQPRRILPVKETESHFVTFLEPLSQLFVVLRQEGRKRFAFRVCLCHDSFKTNHPRNLPADSTPSRKVRPLYCTVCLLGERNLSKFFSSGEKVGDSQENLQAPKGGLVKGSALKFKAIGLGEEEKTGASLEAPMRRERKEQQQSHGSAQTRAQGLVLLLVGGEGGKEPLQGEVDFESQEKGREIPEEGSSQLGAKEGQVEAGGTQELLQSDSQVKAPGSSPEAQIEVTAQRKGRTTLEGEASPCSQGKTPGEWGSGGSRTTSQRGFLGDAAAGGSLSLPRRTPRGDASGQRSAPLRGGEVSRLAGRRSQGRLQIRGRKRRALFGERRTSLTSGGGFEEYLQKKSDRPGPDSSLLIATRDLKAALSLSPTQKDLPLLLQSHQQPS